MSRPPRTVIEYRNYELPADFPIQMLSGENWRISDVPSGVLHFHNCLEIGLCESDGGFLGFRGEQRAFRAGDVTIISGDVPHTTWSDPGTASKWSYLHLDPFELVRPLFPAEALPNGELLQQVNSTPFVRQYDILFNKWGVLLCQKEYQTNDIRRNSREWL